MVQPTRQLVRPRTPNESSNAGKKSVARGKTGDRSSSKKVKSEANVKAEVANVTKKKAKPGALHALLDMPLDVFLEVQTPLFSLTHTRCPLTCHVLDMHASATSRPPKHGTHVKRAS